jgi:MoaA/NifB/PqqE/SkfB family radical SAM enzyme
VKIRKGFKRIALQRLKRLDLPWLFRQGRKYVAIKRAIGRGDGRTTTGPIIAHYFCTRACNLHCPMCPIPLNKTGKALDTGQALALIDALAGLGVTGISFTGGEPLLRSDLFQLMRRAQGHGLDVLLITNGTELDKHAEAILEVRPTSIMVSIDGSTPEIHDRSRGQSGAYQKTLQGIRALKSAMQRRGIFIPLAASAVLTKDNIGDIVNIMALCKSLEFDRLILCPRHDFAPQKCTIPRISGGHDLSRLLLRHPLRGLLDNSDAYLENLGPVISGGDPPQGCRSGYTTILIGDDGRIYPCKCHFETGRPLVDGVAENMDLRKIWYSAKYDDFRKRCGACRECYLTINREFDGLFR